MIYFNFDTILRETSALRPRCYRGQWQLEGGKNTKVEFKLACKLIPSTCLSHFQKQLNFKTALAKKLIPFLWLSHFRNIRLTSGTLREVLPLDVTFLTKYTKEILKNTKQKSRNRIFQFFNLNTILKDV